MYVRTVCGCITVVCLYIYIRTFVYVWFCTVPAIMYLCNSADLSIETTVAWFIGHFSDAEAPLY